MIDNQTGELYTQQEYEALLSNSTMAEIRELDKRLVEVRGAPEAIAELSANLAVSKAALDKIHEDARKRAYKKLR